MHPLAIQSYGSRLQATVCTVVPDGNVNVLRTRDLQYCPSIIFIVDKLSSVALFVSINHSTNEHQRLPPVQEVAATLKNDQSKNMCSSCSLHSQK